MKNRSNVPFYRGLRWGLLGGYGKLIGDAIADHLTPDRSCRVNNDKVRIPTTETLE